MHSLPTSVPERSAAFSTELTLALAPIVTAHFLRIAEKQVEFKQAQLTAASDKSDEDKAKELLAYSTAIGQDVLGAIIGNTELIAATLWHRNFGPKEQPAPDPEPQQQNGDIQVGILGIDDTEMRRQADVPAMVPTIEVERV